MNQIQFIGTTPNELVGQISESVFEKIRLLSIQPPQPQEEVLTRKETALFFKVSLVTIHDWVQSGILKAYKVGNRTYFKRSELMSVVEHSNSTRP
jgi:excisionase family DNA binding protein